MLRKLLAARQHQAVVAKSLRAILAVQLLAVVAKWPLAVQLLAVAAKWLLAILAVQLLAAVAKSLLAILAELRLATAVADRRSDAVYFPSYSVDAASALQHVILAT